MFGQTPTPINGYNEQSIFTPVSPYGCAKLYGYHITRTYRTGYNLFASNGILFNHESYRRGPTFVTRKITRAAARIKLGIQKELVLGNLGALRDWGHSKDYMRAIHLILQQPEPGDYVVATGEQHSVEEFLYEVFDYFDLDTTKYLKYDPSYLRPNEVPNLLGDSTKIRALGWKPEYNFKSLVAEMCSEDYKIESNGRQEI
jgi:GDPmannose 4,6-dehydratase